MDLANIESCPEREKYVLIIMHEMHIREGIVYDKHTGTSHFIKLILIVGHVCSVLMNNNQDTLIAPVDKIILIIVSCMPRSHDPVNQYIVVLYNVNILQVRS